jgi:hypothetical protein
VINRGNYRSWIFETEGARHAFLLCLKECCDAKSWLADNLSMGKPSSVQSWVSNKREDEGVKEWLKNYKIMISWTDPFLRTS